MDTTENILLKMLNQIRDIWTFIKWAQDYKMNQ